ncbi:MAG: sulfurtransferase-like selenium metabolism protein YedF [Desulfuromonadales bacterium]
MTALDCRNQACPTPVVMTRKALEEHGAVAVLLDDGAPRENVARFARNRGYTVTEEREAEGWRLTISSDGSQRDTLPSPIAHDTTVLITSDRLGDGPDELGSLLMKNFIFTLLESPHQPLQIIFINTGVRLTTEGSDVIEALDKLAGMGIEILSCGLCLDFFGIKAKLRSGRTTNMLATVEAVLSEGRVVRL